MERSLAHLALLLVGCGAATRNANVVRISPPRIADADEQLPVEPCRPARTFGDVIVVGGTKADDLRWGVMHTLDDGDGVLASEGELSWWSKDGTCRWRLPIRGVSAFGPDRVWIATEGGLEEVDAEGRVHRKVNSVEVATLVGPFAVTRDDERWTIWRLDAQRAVATVNVRATEVTAALTADGELALLAGSFPGSDRRPRLFVPGRFDVAVAEAPTGSGKLALLPDGGFLVALEPAGMSKKISFARVSADGKIVWWSQSEELAFEARVEQVGADGTVDVQVPVITQSRPVRFAIDLETGRSSSVAAVRDRHWLWGTLGENLKTVGDQEIPLETWTVQSPREMPYTATAGAVWLTRPAR